MPPGVGSVLCHLVPVGSLSMASIQLLQLCERLWAGTLWPLGQTACPGAQAVQSGDILVAQVGMEHIAVGVGYPQCDYSSRLTQGCAVHTAEAKGLSDPTGHVGK